MPSHVSTPGGATAVTGLHSEAGVVVVYDGIADLDAEVPTVVSVSDVHGYRDRFESALLTLDDHPGFRPVVERRENGRLRWTGGDEYALVVNGDVVDRGPDSEGCLALVRRLQRQAPDGHVRHLLGNHELYLAYPSPPEWDRWYTETVVDDDRRRFLERIAAGDVAVAFEGHAYTYVHAGAPDGVDPRQLNEGLRAVAAAVLDALGDDGERETFRHAFRRHCPAVYREEDSDVPVREDPDAGVVWLDFSFLPPDAPPQVVGHTPHETVTRTGNGVCEDVIVANADSPGGEAVLVETSDSLRALVREPDGSVSVRTL